MKRLFFSLLIFLANHHGFAQPQRLALLPSSMKFIEAGERIAPSLCLDYFRAAPGAADELYAYNVHQYLNGGSSSALSKYEFNPETYGNYTVKNQLGERVVSPITKPLILSANNDLSELSPLFKRFLEDKIKEYNIPGFNQIRLEKLQSEIWEYDVLNKLGYISQADQFNQGFINAKRKFFQDFYPAGYNTNSDDILKFGEDIKGFVKLKESESSNIIVVKSFKTKEYIVFADIAKPIYRGLDENEIVNYLAEQTTLGNKDICSIVFKNFESPEKEEAFLLNTKRKLDLKLGKNISVTSRPILKDYAGEYKIIQEFREADIKEIQYNNGVAFSGRAELNEPSNPYRRTQSVEAISNKKSILSTYFEAFAARIKSMKDKFILRKLTQEIKTLVTRDISASDFLEIIIDEGYRKILVKIYKVNTKITIEYACN